MKVYIFGVVLFSFLSGGCSTYMPSDPNNLCTIFTENEDWYEDAKSSRDRWGAPLHVMMAIMKQESSFVPDAKPPMEYFLFIPIGRASSAYGYAQAQDPAWENYQKSSGNTWSSRDDFADAIDFIGWYMNISHKKNGVSKWDAYRQYLNYHEGWGGYSRQSYKGKKWLLNVAGKVASQSALYSSQLKKCKL
jgi:hypothetical protein